MYNFHKTGNLKADLKIGKYDLRNHQFPDASSLIDWIISILPHILETEEIPSDIISGITKVIPEHYYEKIIEFCENKNITIAISGNKKPYGILIEKLEKMGFRRFSFSPSVYCNYKNK